MKHAAMVRMPLKNLLLIKIPPKGDLNNYLTLAERILINKHC